MKTHPTRLCFLFVLSAIVFCACAAKPPEFGDVVSYDQVQEWLRDSNAETIIVDIRRDDEIASGMIPGARHIPSEELAERIYELPRDARIVLYCKSGIRVKNALPLFKKMGHTQVYNFVSVSNWQGALEKP